MTRILDFNGHDAERTVTVAAISALKGSGRRFTQVTAGSADEAIAAEAAGIEMAVCLADAVADVRRGSSRLFVTAAIDFGGAVTLDDLLATAFQALRDGADAVITARRLDAIRLLAAEGVPVMGHGGFVPKRSSQYGGVRAVGNTAAEATTLWRQFQEFEAAGAFAVECELIPAAVMAEINRRTGMATISLGSGPDADVMFLFSNDVCGESQRAPRHARVYGDVAKLQRQIADERVRALTAFRADVLSGSFPAETELSRISRDELAVLRSSLEEA
ncbi:MAG TPA: 3-methyl-2-oxobutanoate hydroxymethyltransferase [Ilumatobacteraceae bacterium]|nr:3-methyl-2-oxobutanoate hydroxymethyltransferase [Ilumatobacteraceae bacterium]HRB03488.1 3-methyl-2-oxobutanoate hydroxymethyltransferase [Ilumatobacteraceae bacterium]